MSKQLRLAVQFLAYGGQISAHHARMWLELGAAMIGSEARFALASFGFVDLNPVDKARNFALALAFNSKADWLLMVDADTWVESDGEDDAGFQLLRMISEADHAGAVVVVAPVVPRGLTHSQLTGMPMAYRHAENGPPRLLPIELGIERRGLVPIDAAATAIMAIKIAEIGESRFSFTDDLSEDLHFCKQVQEHAGATHALPLVSSPIRCDTRVRTGHLSRTLPLYNRGPR